MKLVIKYIKEYKLEAVMAPLFKMLEALFELFVPLVIARLIDEGITKGNMNVVWQSAICLCLLAIIGLISSVTAQYFAAKAAIGSATALRFDLFKRLQQFSFSDIDRVGTDTMLTRLTSDLNLVQTGINMTLRLFLRSPFIVFGAMIMAFTINVRAALIFALTIPALAIVVYGIMLKSIPMFRMVQSHLDSLLSLTRENLTGVRVIRAFGIESKEIDEFDKRNKALNKLQRKVGSLSGMEGPITFVIINAATLWLLYAGAIKVNEGILTTGAVVALVNYMSQILVELVKLANLIVTMSKGIAGADRISEIMDSTELCKHEDDKCLEKGEIPKNDIELCKPIFEFRNVELTYAGNAEPSLTQISFSVNSGQTIGIVGGTGSGKSSLANMLPRFYEATKGCVLYKGEDIRNVDQKQLRDEVAIVLQKAVLFKGTVADNLRFGREGISDDELKASLKRAQAYDFVFDKDGLDTEVLQGGTNFSGGQKQRLHIARALAGNPSVLILDDSASALDYATDAALRKAIAEYDKECTVFIISQRTASVMNADMIIVLDDGKIAGMGTHEELLKSCAIYKEIHNA